MARVFGARQQRVQYFYDTDFLAAGVISTGVDLAQSEKELFAAATPGNKVRTNMPAAGFLTGKYRRGGEVPKGTRFDVIPGHQRIYFTDHGFATLEGLEAVSRESGRSMIQLSLTWALGRPGITSVLVGARSTDQVDQAFVAERDGLDSELRRRLDEISSSTDLHPQT